MDSFIADVLSTPVYVIAAHSCIVSPHYAKTTKSKHYFIVPKDTYIVSFGSPGDHLYTDTNTIQTIHEGLDDMRKFMYCHGSDDVTNKPKTKKRTVSLFGDIKRAAPTTKYPNICYTMDNVDRERPTRRAYNPHGVYRIDHEEQVHKLTNKYSYVAQDVDIQDFYLNDIIEEVYQKTGIRKGIFINLGCLSAFRGTATSKYMEDAERMYEEANLLYNTVLPTLTQEELLKQFGQNMVPNDIRISKELAKWSPDVFEKMVLTHLLHPRSRKSLT